MSDERDEFERGRTQEARRLPVAYTDPSTGRTFSKSAPVCGVTEDEIRRFSHGGQMCGECKFFERGHAQAEMARTNFVRTLVKDYEWNPNHAGLTRETADEVGLCAADGNMATAVFTPACDQFRHSKGRIKKEATREQKGIFVKDVRAANDDHAARFREFKRKHGLDDPEIVGD